MMTILIVDDSPTDRKLLKKDLIKLGEDEKNILEAKNENDFLKAVRDEKPDVVFLDISLGQEHAFDILDKIIDRTFELVFITGHSQYAIDSYRYSALDYLTKPTHPKRLEEALTRVKKVIGEKMRSKRQEMLLYNISDFPKFEQRIILANKDEVHHKRLNEILYIQSDHPLCIFYFLDGTRIGVNSSLKHYEENLRTFHFFRIHNRCLVNLYYVDAYVWSEDAVKLTAGSTLLRVARERKDAFFEALSRLSIK